jgi:hypothetical protein
MVQLKTINVGSELVCEVLAVSEGWGGIIALGMFVVAGALTLGVERLLGRKLECLGFILVLLFVTLQILIYRGITGGPLFAEEKENIDHPRKEDNIEVQERNADGEDIFYKELITRNCILFECYREYKQYSQGADEELGSEYGRISFYDYLFYEISKECEVTDDPIVYVKAIIECYYYGYRIVAGDKEYATFEDGVFAYCENNGVKLPQKWRSVVEANSEEYAEEYVELYEEMFDVGRKCKNVK